MLIRGNKALFYVWGGLFVMLIRGNDVLFHAWVELFIGSVYQSYNI